MNIGTPTWTERGGSVGFEVLLESAPTAGAEARDLVGGLSDLVSSESLFSLRAVVTELVNNSVCHGSGGPIAVGIAVTSDGLTRGTVSDGGQGPVEIALPRPPGAGGLGLRIVDALASRWGVEAPSSDVWFEV